MYRTLFLCGALVAIGLLFRSAFTGALEYYVTVEELQTGPALPAGRVIKLGGVVQPGSLARTDATPPQYRFAIAQGSRSVPVRYVGFVPDTFHEGGEVVATGRLAADGTLDATDILAKCASKYTAAPGAQ